LIEIGSKTAEKNPAQTNKQTDRQTDRQTDKPTNRHYENNGHLAVNQQYMPSCGRTSLPSNKADLSSPLARLRTAATLAPSDSTTYESKARTLLHLGELRAMERILQMS